jgi:putative sigma-54 modulation protein
MDTTIQFVNTHSDDRAHDLAMDKLEDLKEKYSWIVRGDVFFKEETGNGGDRKICEIRLSLPGNRIFASSTETNFEKAVVETVADLERQLKKRKSEMYRSK